MIAVRSYIATLYAAIVLRALTSIGGGYEAVLLHTLHLYSLLHHTAIARSSCLAEKRSLSQSPTVSLSYAQGASK